MTDIARIVGVSQSTVSMILNENNKTSFPKETIEKVLAVAKQLNYQPRKALKKNLQPEKKNIMVFAVKMSNPYYSMILQSIESEAALRGYNVLCCNTYHNPVFEQRYLSIAIEEKFAGVIFLYPPDHIQAFFVAAEEIPTIAICDRASELKTDIVELDNFKAGRLAAEHLVQLGHRNIALLTQPPDGNTGRIARIDGVSSVLEENHCLDRLILHKYNPNSQESSHSLENIGYDYQIGHLLAQEKSLYESEVTAFICINDMLAFGLIDALHEKGYRVPDDYSVISFDNLLYSGFSSIQLTTVDHHMEAVGQYAIGMLLQKINTVIYKTKYTSDIVARFKVESPPSLVIRNSTRRLN